VDRYFESASPLMCTRNQCEQTKVARIVAHTRTRELTREDKNIPEPPKDFRYAMFTCKTKKNRWGRDVAVPEEMNYEVLNGEDDQKVSIQKEW
jgi:ClpP class serine protease